MCAYSIVCWIFWWFSSCVILYCQILLTIVVLDSWMGMDHLRLWLLKIAADYNIWLEDGLVLSRNILYHNIWEFAWLYWSCNWSELEKKTGRERSKERGRIRERRVENCTSWSTRNLNSMNSYLFFILYAIVCYSKIFINKVLGRMRLLQTYTNPIAGNYWCQLNWSNSPPFEFDSNGTHILYIYPSYLWLYFTHFVY